jgi:hypothetical protein
MPLSIDLGRLRALVQQGLCADNLRDIVPLCANLCRLETAESWFFLLLNRCLSSLLDFLDGNPIDADRAEILLGRMQKHILDGLDDAIAGRSESVRRHANLFSKAYSQYHEIAWRRP